jgi:hypothetical protein
MSFGLKGLNQFLSRPLLNIIKRTCARGTTHHQAELNTLLDILLSADFDLWES